MSGGLGPPSTALPQVVGLGDVAACGPVAGQNVAELVWRGVREHTSRAHNSEVARTRYLYVEQPDLVPPGDQPVADGTGMLTFPPGGTGRKEGHPALASPDRHRCIASYRT